MTFGGGYAMMPILEREVIDKKDWVSLEDAMDFYAIAQCTPGIIGINTSAHVGYKAGKVSGAVAAAVGFFTPSVIIIMVIAGLISRFSHLEAVVHAFNGIKIGVAAIIVNAVVKMLKVGIVDVLAAVLCAAAFAVMMLFDVSPIIIIVAAVALGILIGVIRAKRAAQKPASDGGKGTEDRQ